MKKLLYTIILCIATQHASFSQQKDPADTAFINAGNQWFNAWKLLSKEIFHVNKVQPVDFVFFDSQYVYATSPVSIPSGANINGPSMMNDTYLWKKTLHNGTITLPDSSHVPIGLISFAAENKINNKAFFVMPLPSFWKSAGVTSKELGLENMITGVFLHEFSHSQQMQNFGKRITALEKFSEPVSNFTDDIVQDFFSKDSLYTSLFRQEVDELYAAAQEKNKAHKKQLIQQAMSKIKARQANYFTGKYTAFTPIDDFFLTMEGLGQYAMYAWLKHAEGANIPQEQVITGVRRGKKQWSQDEGFALFLILEQYAPARKWAPGMFGTTIESATDLILKNIK